MMNISQINAYDITGGVERIAWILFKLYQKLGHKSWLVVGHKITTDTDVFQLDSTLASVPGSKLFWKLHCRLAPLQDKLRGIKEIRDWLHTQSGGWQEKNRRLGREQFQYPGPGIY